MICIWGYESSFLQKFYLEYKLLESTVSYEESISLIQKLFDDFVLASMRYCTKILLFLLLIHQHLIAYITLREQPVHQHQVFTNVEYKWVCLRYERSTWGRIYFDIIALKYTLLFSSKRTVSQFRPQYVSLFLWRIARAFATFDNNSILLR